MMSPYCERAYEDALRFKKAILKFISANDVDLTGAHQRGYYMPKEVWRLFTPDSPERGVNKEHKVKITWQDGLTTVSKVKWYGKGTRNEYRITSFGSDFPFRTFDNLGDLLVIVPKSFDEFNAYVLDIDEDIEEIQAALGIEIIRSWTVYEEGGPQPETEDQCLRRLFREFTEAVTQFPDVRVFSDTTMNALAACLPGFDGLPPDSQLVRLVKEEYNLYLMVERKVFQPEIQRLFASIDDFLQTAMSILQARKSRAGRSLENHVEYLFRRADIPFEMRRILDGTRPDIIIPSKAAYDNARYPTDKLFMVGVKRTCKDRWRQVLREAPRIRRKHILTMQEGISGSQLDEMRRARVTLVVPEPLHREYPSANRRTLLTLDAFIRSLKAQLLP